MSKFEMDPETKKYYDELARRSKDRQNLNDVLAESIHEGRLVLYGFRTTVTGDEITIQVKDPTKTFGIEFFNAVTPRVKLLPREKRSDRDLVMIIDKTVITTNDVLENLPEFFQNFWPQLSDLQLEIYPDAKHPVDIDKPKQKVA